MLMKRSYGTINTLFDAVKPSNNLLTNIIVIILLWVGTYYKNQTNRTFEIEIEGQKVILNLYKFYKTLRFQTIVSTSTHHFEPPSSHSQKKKSFPYFRKYRLPLICIKVDRVFEIGSYYLNGILDLFTATVFMVFILLLVLNLQ